MLSPFYRAELASTFDMARQGEIRRQLSAAQIDYRLKVVNRQSASPFAAGSRADTGALGQNQDMAYEYRFYVRKTDRDQARYAIRPR